MTGFAEMIEQAYRYQYGLEFHRVLSGAIYQHLKMNTSDHEMVFPCIGDHQPTQVVDMGTMLRDATRPTTET